MDGFLNVLKPPGMTSSDVVMFVRKRLPRGVKVGHGGTLDPEAAGVLPVCVGKATRLFDYVIDKRKEYICQLQLGVCTDTQDATGRIVERWPVSVDGHQVRAALQSMVGEIEQVPPAFSAIKRDGKRLYQLAREGRMEAVEPRKIRVYEAEYLGEMGENGHRIRFVCGKGTYIRTLCHDLGQVLGCGGHMAFLLRSKAGIFDLERAHTLEEIERAADQGRMEGLLAALDAPLEGLAWARIGGEQRRLCLNGNPVRPESLSKSPEQGDIFRIYCQNDFAGIGEWTPEGKIRFRAMLLGDK